MANEATAGSPPPPPTRSWLERLWSSIADRGQPFADVPAATVPPLDRARQLARTLLSGSGEASGAALARELVTTLRELGPGDASAFQLFLAQDFAPDDDRLRAAAERYLSEPGPASATKLFEASEPPRQELIRRMNMAAGGTAALIEMRCEMLKRLRDNPELKPLETDLHHLLSSWFNRGFLELRRIDWQTPAAVLEKLIAYEAVHEIQGWDDLRRRLAADRRCFAFFHPALPGEPLIFVEVALVQGLASAVQPLLAKDGEADGARAARAADTAIFYSISNCQQGLKGVSFGNFLIKQVVEELKAELPNIKRFSTLSPVPGFARWLQRKLPEEGGEGTPDLVRESEAEALRLAVPDAADPSHALAALLRMPDWVADKDQAEALHAPLLRLCAEFLTAENDGRGPSDPVAKFHLGNGARLERVNWLGNTAKRGLRESHGIMVNYLYDPDAIERNHEAFVRNGTVARSAEVDALLVPGVPKRLPRPPRLRLRGERAA